MDKNNTSPGLRPEGAQHESPGQRPGYYLRGKDGRRGVSLIEILVTIGIVSIGLLGSLSLIAAGQHQAAHGTISDRIGEIGRNAHREFKIRDMNNPANWVTASGGSFGSFMQGTLVKGSWVWGTVPPQAVIIDPWSVAEQGDGNYPLAGGTYPIPRISLRAFPYSPMAPTSVMSLQQARLVFEAHDDLKFIEPEDDFHLQQQVFLTDGPNGTGNRVRRDAKNDFSWVAMLARMPEAGNNMYRLSIIVYYRREIPALGDPTIPERQVAVSLIGGGYTGGNVVLSSNNFADLSVNPGEWMMLAGDVDPGANIVPIYRWYRIILADNAVTGAGPYSRNVTLSGPDWDVTSITNTVGVVYTKPLATPRANGEFNNNPFEGIVGVYEKTIRLQTSSLWAN